jgi:hypothetical protein
MLPVRTSLAVAFVCGAILAGGGCYHIKGGPAPLPSGFPSSGPTPTPAGTCNPLSTSTTALVDVSQGILSIRDPVYGNILGYAPDPGTGFPATTASTITLRSSDVVQFINVDQAAPFSAVGFGTTSFPPVPYTFPSGTQNPIGTALGSSQWSTGRIPPFNTANGMFCYSQPFTLPRSGTVVYFGDFDHYNTTNGTFRDVIIVSGAAPRSHRRRAPVTVAPPR